MATIARDVAGRPLGVPEIVPGYLAGLVALVGGSLLTPHAAAERVRAIWWDELRREPTPEDPARGADTEGAFAIGDSQR